MNYSITEFDLKYKDPDDTLKKVLNSMKYTNLNDVVIIIVIIMIVMMLIITLIVKIIIIMIVYIIILSIICISKSPKNNLFLFM